MPLVPEKKYRSQYEGMTADSLVSDRRIIADSIPKHMIIPKEDSRERIEKTKPDFYAPERAPKSEDTEEPSYPKRKPPVPQEEKIPVPQRKPQRTQYANGDGADRFGASGGNFFDYKKGGRTGLSADRPPSQPHAGGLLHSDGAGRTDILNRNVEAGSYVIPADVVSALGDGNTMAGAKVLDQMMGTKPVKPAPFLNVPQPNYMPPARKESPVPIIAAGGEYIVSPASIMEKFGSLEHGHDSLDQFVKAVRAKNVKKLNNLPGPRT